MPAISTYSVPLAMPNLLPYPIIKTPYITEMAKARFEGTLPENLQLPLPDIQGLIDKAGQNKFTPENRKLLVDALRNQYLQTGITPDQSPVVFENIEALNQTNTYTVTTGQQIHVMLGPLFFIYKIRSLMAYVELFNKTAKDCTVVPMFWMASEDHDLEEINHVKLYNETFNWQAEAGNAVGRFSCEGIAEMIDAAEARADKTDAHAQMFALFRKYYTPNRTLSQATRLILNELYGAEGLIILDPDDAALKQLFLPVAKADILNKIAFNTVNVSNKVLKTAGFETRVNAREINYFWLDNGKRHKLKMTDDQVFIDDSNIELSVETMLSQPEKISPNVLTRPLYQESILPNILYLGGGAEVEYWLPLQQTFEKCNLVYPVLLMRDSVLMLSNKNLDAITAAGFEWFDMFKPETELASIFAEKHNHESQRVELLIQNLQAQLQELKTDFEKRDSTPGNIHREINELQKGIARLTKLVADETLRLQKDNQALSKILKIKAKFFDKKQERDEFLIQYPEALNIRFHKSDACFPELVLKAV